MPPSNPRITSSPHFHRYTVEKASRWIPSAAYWGIAAGVGVLLFAEGVPIFRRDILGKIPGLSDYYKKEAEKVPDSDKPF